MEEEFEVQTPTRLGSNKKEKAIQLLNNGDMDSFFKCKELIIKIINKNKYDD